VLCIKIKLAAYLPLATAIWKNKNDFSLDRNRTTQCHMSWNFFDVFTRQWDNLCIV